MQPIALLLTHAGLWRDATHHPFLDGVRDGSLPPPALDRWLAQDYQFVARELTAQALVLARAARGDQALLVQGLAALEAELGWFEEQARGRRLALDAPLHPTCRAYGDFLEVMAAEPYAVALTVLWTLERAYLDAWSATRPGAPAYRAFVAHWTVPEFAAYVALLEAAAARALAAAPVEAQSRAEAAFRWTALYEARFWQMAFTDA